MTDEERAAAFGSYLTQKPHSLQPDVHNRPVITTREFMQFRDWIVARASGARERSVLNATGGGILHGGTILQTTFDGSETAAVTRCGAAIGQNRGAWKRSVPTADISARVGEALMSPAALPIGEWLDFGGDTATAEQILSAAADSANQMSAACRR